MDFRAFKCFSIDTALPVAGADVGAALVASRLRGTLPPVDLRAVCLIRAVVTSCLRGALRAG